MKKRFLLGKVRQEFNGNTAGQNVYLKKHSWDCDWYWGFGYVGNSTTHTHFDTEFLVEETDIDKIFEKTELTQKDWWVLRDLFVQAYALKKCAEVYRHGGHQTTVPGITDIIENKEMGNKINKDLEKILVKIWEVLGDRLGNGKKQTPQIQMNNFLKENGIMFMQVKALSNPNFENSWVEKDNYYIRFENIENEDRKYSMYYSKGKGHNGEIPNSFEVLECMIRDYKYIRECNSLETFCNEMGYDTVEQKKKARNVFDSMRTQAIDMVEFFGHDLVCKIENKLEEL